MGRNRNKPGTAGYTWSVSLLAGARAAVCMWMGAVEALPFEFQEKTVNRKPLPGSRPNKGFRSFLLQFLVQRKNIVIATYLVFVLDGNSRVD